MPSITLLYAGLLAIWFLVLSARVIQRRRDGRIFLGDGNDPEMLRRMRAHANFAEYVPLLLVLFGLLELRGASPLLLHFMGASLLLARIGHGVAMAFTRHWVAGRFFGTLITFINLLLAGLACIWFGLSGL